MHAIQSHVFRWEDQTRPIIGLSPMADMTDTPFNLIAKEHGAPVIFKEMVSSEAVIRKNEKTIRMAMNEDAERPIIQQIFGSDPKHMAEAAKIIEESCCPDGIDINMGCPVYKLTSNFDGAALMKDPKLAHQIVTSMKNAISTPLSVKMRLGWSDDKEVLEFAKVIEDAGAELISIHGRTKSQGYAGVANWDRIGEVKRSISIPVLVNGDIVSVETAKEALKRSEADGCLIGRGALGSPWIFRELTAALHGGEKVLAEPTLEEHIAIVLKHAELHVAHYGERGMVTFRKHLAYYFKGIPGWKAVRQELMQVTTLEGLREALNRLVE